MTEYVFSAPDLAALAAAGAATGFFDAATQSVIATGPLGGGGSWFYNFVGLVEGAVGVWGRLRVNGESDRMPQILAVARAMGVTIYEETPGLGWSADGVTTGPAYIKDMGIIYLTPRDIRGRYLLMERIRRTLTRR